MLHTVHYHVKVYILLSIWKHLLGYWKRISNYYYYYCYCVHQKKNISQLITSMQCWPSVLWESLSLNIHHNSLVLNSKTETRMYTASFSSSHYQQKYLRTYVRYTHWKKNIKHSLNIKKKKNTHYIIYYIYESSRIKS